MSDLPASHYLDIYTHRIRMAESGMVHSKPGVLDGAKRLVSALGRLAPTEPIHLEADAKGAVFTKASTGELLAKIEINGNKN